MSGNERKRVGRPRPALSLLGLLGLSLSVVAVQCTVPFRRTSTVQASPSHRPATGPLLHLTHRPTVAGRGSLRFRLSFRKLKVGAGFESDERKMSAINIESVNLAPALAFESCHGATTSA